MNQLNIFDIYYFLKLSNNDKINYLKDFNEINIFINKDLKTDYKSDHVNLWNNLISLRYTSVSHPELIIELVKRKFIIRIAKYYETTKNINDNTNIIVYNYVLDLTHNNNIPNEIWIKIIDILDNNNWIKEEEYKDLIFKFLLQSSDFKQIDIPTKKYLVNVYKKHNILNNLKTSNIIKSYKNYNLESLIFIIDTCYENNIEIDPSLVVSYIYNKYYEAQKDYQTNFCCLINKCIEYKIPLCIKPIIKDKEIIYGDIIGKLTEIYNDWNTIMKVIKMHIELELPINIKNKTALNVASRFGIGAVNFILENCDKNDLLNIKTDDFYKNEMSFLDTIIAFNSLETLKLCMKHGLIPINNKFTLYVPCLDCHNGESYYCNFRTITTNYVCLKRYGVNLKGLLENINTLPDTTEFKISYYDFLNRVDKNNKNEVHDFPDYIPEDYWNNSDDEIE